MLKECNLFNVRLAQYLGLDLATFLVLLLLEAFPLYRVVYITSL